MSEDAFKYPSREQRSFASLVGLSARGLVIEMVKNKCAGGMTRIPAGAHELTIRLNIRKNRGPWFPKTVCPNLSPEQLAVLTAGGRIFDTTSPAPSGAAPSHTIAKGGTTTDDLGAGDSTSEPSPMECGTSVLISLQVFVREDRAEIAIKSKNTWKIG